MATAKAMKMLGEKYDVDLPITNAIYSIIYEKRDYKKVLLDLFARDTKKEFCL